jgi:hypothetical protein
MVFYKVGLMTFNHFKCLSADDQQSILWRRAVELVRMRGVLHHYILYQVDGFYLEVQYLMPKRTIIQIACFEDTDLLEPYLHQIDIDSLYTA